MSAVERRHCVRDCGREALDGHLTCGMNECDERGARADMEAAARVISADPREQRALALRRLARARYELECAHGYLKNSDQASIVLDDAQGLIDKVGHLQHTLEWRQRREATP